MVKTEALSSQGHCPPRVHSLAVACVPSPLTPPGHINRKPVGFAAELSSAALIANIPLKRIKKNNSMSPSISAEASQPLLARSTVAQRKQANELRKVRKTNKCSAALRQLDLFSTWRSSQPNDAFHALFADFETVAGEEKTRSHQRQSEPPEESDPAACRERQRTVLQAGKGWYFGNDSALPKRPSVFPSQRWASFVNPHRLFKLLLSSLLSKGHPNKTLSHFSPDSAESYREGYKACLHRVSALLPKTSLDEDACQKVQDFIKQSMTANVMPTCLNCCAQSSRAFPQIHQRLQSLKSNFSSRLDSQSRSNGAATPNRAQQSGAQPVSAAMWRPW